MKILLRSSVMGSAVCLGAFSVLSPATAEDDAKRAHSSIMRLQTLQSVLSKKPTPYAGGWRHLGTFEAFQSWLQSHSEANESSAEDASEQLSRQESDRVNMPLGLLKFGKEQVPQAAVPEAVFINPWGVKSWLQEKGINILIDNTNEFGAALTSPTSGLGLKQGSSNTGQVGYLVNTD